MLRATVRRVESWYGDAPEVGGLILLDPRPVLSGIRPLQNPQIKESRAAGRIGSSSWKGVSVISTGMLSSPQCDHRLTKGPYAVRAARAPLDS